MNFNLRAIIGIPGFVLLLGMLLSACAQAATTPTTLTDLTDIQTLRAAFNQDAGKPRLILLAAPT